MKNISTNIKKFIAFIMFVLESCITAISEDLTLLAFLIVAIIPNVIIKITSDMSIFNLRSLFFNFAWFCLVVALSYNYKKNKTRIVYFSIISFIIYLLVYANILYYRFYEGNFLSLSLVKQLALLPDVADAPGESISTFDIMYWITFGIAIIFIIFISRFKRKDAKHNFLEMKSLNRLNFLRAGLFSFVLGIAILAPANYSQAQKLWNRPIVVEDFGLYNYHIIDIFKSMSVFVKHTPDEKEYMEFVNYFKEKNKETTKNAYTDILKGKNIIVIHAESLENFLIYETITDVEGNEIEITPYFNKIAREGLYFSRFYSQQSIGTSADSEFVFNTSLLPVNNGTVFLTHFDRTYVTTQSLLQEQNYLTMYMHGNNGSFWNRDVMDKVLGYDVFYSKNEYSFTENQEIGLGISDYDFFQQSISYLANAPTPYYATLITLTNHTPWTAVDKYITKDALGVEEPAIDCESIGEDFENTTTCRYLKSVHYADWAFGEFWKSLEKRGLLENTAIVVYGDHPAKLPVSELETLLDTNLSRLEYTVFSRVPFMIWSKDVIEPKEIDSIMGEYDVGPTLQNMLGIKNEYALGYDIFSVKNHIVPFVNGDWTDGIIYYSYRDDDYIIMDERYSTEDIEKMNDEYDYIKIQSERADSIINMSNMINKYDLIAFHKAKLLKETDKRKSGGKND